MEPQVRFCTTSDGVGIAYMTIGTGFPIVRCFGWFTHLEYEWARSGPMFQAQAEARGLMYVLYDGRGMGLSDRDVDDLSLDAQIRDLEAVTGALGLERMLLSAISQGGPTAVTYAARHPERVAALMFYGSFAKLPWSAEFAESLATVAEQGWGSDNPAFRQMFTGLFMPDADHETVQWFSELQRVSATPAMAARMIRSLIGSDVRQLLPEITAPTLVGHRREEAVVPFEAGRELATRIPNARLVALEGRNHAFLGPGDPGLLQWMQAVMEFMDSLPEMQHEEAEAERRDSGLVTILFTDLQDSTKMTQRLGDARAQEVVRTHNDMIKVALDRFGGRRIKHTGDGVMAAFSSAAGAIACAVQLQQALAQYNDENTELPIRVRMGLNAGEPIAEDDDLFGTAVIAASRIADQASAGEILVADVVRQLVAGKGFSFEDKGHRVLKGFDEAVQVHAVQWS